MDSVGGEQLGAGDRRAARAGPGGTGRHDQPVRHPGRPAGPVEAFLLMPRGGNTGGILAGAAG